MGRTAPAVNAAASLSTSTALGDEAGVGQPVDPFETLPNGGSSTAPIDLALAPQELDGADGDLTSDIDDDERRCSPHAEDASPEAFARMRLAMAFAQD